MFGCERPEIVWASRSNRGAASRIRSQMLWQDFNRYGAVQARVACAVYLAHAPSSTQCFQDLVARASFLHLGS
jgi:hypothetical protein